MSLEEPAHAPQESHQRVMRPPELVSAHGPTIMRVDRSANLRLGRRGELLERAKTLLDWQCPRLSRIPDRAAQACGRVGGNTAIGIKLGDGGWQCLGES